MSELSTASDCVKSSQQSGSDSCGENLVPQYESAQCNFDECAFEDPSQSDTPHWPRSNQFSDSDCTTPRSHDAATATRSEEGRGGDARDPQRALWENIKSEISRVELSRDRLPRRLDITQSPGSAGAMGNFRESYGMNESGPVIPFGHGAHRDAINSMMPPHSGEYEAVGAAVPGPAATSASGAASGAGHPQFSPLPRAASEGSGTGYGANQSQQQTPPLQQQQPVQQQQQQHPQHQHNHHHRRRGRR